MSEHPHKRHSSGGGKKGVAGPHKGPKGSSNNSAEVRRKAHSKHTRAARSREESDDEAMASFPQFCANCDKQIIVPDHRILFCSTECKRQDRISRASSMASIEASPPQTPLSETYSFESLSKHPHILAQRSPSIAPASLHQNRYSVSSLSSIDRHPSSSEEDASRPRMVREPSDASRWLGSFRGSETNATTSSSAHTRGNKQRRPHAHRTHSAAPSLSNTPLGSYSTNGGMSLPYTPRSMSTALALGAAGAGGVLPPRYNPYSPASYGSRSTDLVTPMSALSMTAPSDTLSSLSALEAEQGAPRKSAASTGTSFGTIVQGEILSYEKKSLDALRERSDGGSGGGVAGMTPTGGSLKQLFAFARTQSGGVVRGA